MMGKHVIRVIGIKKLKCKEITVRISEKIN
jgi:hypothetical protein